MNIIEAIESDKIFRPLFKDLRTWKSWLVFLRALFALPMERRDRKLFRKCTGRQRIPKQPAKESYVICGRRSGKSYISSVIACYLAVFIDWSPYLSPGEKGNIFIISNDKAQSQVIKNYVSAVLHSQPMFDRMIERELTDEIHLSNNTSIIIKASDFRTLRGYTVLAAICEELAFWRSEDYSNPAQEIIRSLKPSLATVAGSLLVGISTPYSKSGYLYQQFKELYGLNSSVLIWRSDTLTMNPTIDRNIIKADMQSDPSSARAEWGAEFREDLEAFLPLSLIEAAIIQDRISLPAYLHQDRRYFGFVDPSGGRSDSMTLGIAHKDEKSSKIVLDYLYEQKPPFQPEQVCYQFSQVLKGYGIEVVKGDRYAGDWVTSSFRKHGIMYEPSTLSKSEIYLSFLPLMSNHSVELLDSKRLVNQLRGLERHTRSGGKDSIDHYPGGHDDVANAACGAVIRCWQASNYERLPPPSFGISIHYESLEERMEREARKWLCDDKPKKRDKREDRLGKRIDDNGNVIPWDELDDHELSDEELDRKMDWEERNLLREAEGQLERDRRAFLRDRKKRKL